MAIVGYMGIGSTAPEHKAGPTRGGAHQHARNAATQTTGRRPSQDTTAAARQGATDAANQERARHASRNAEPRQGQPPADEEAAWRAGTARRATRPGTPGRPRIRPKATKLAQDLVLKSAPIATIMNTALDSLAALQTTQAGAAPDESNAAFGRSLQILLALIAGGIVLGLRLGLYVARSLATPLKAMVAAANGIAEGDLNQEITLDRKDEVGQAAAAFRRAIMYLRSMAEVADAMAEGDLTRTVEPQSARDGLGTAFKKMIANLRDLVGQVPGSALSLADTSAQLGDAAAQARGGCSAAAAAAAPRAAPPRGPSRGHGAPRRHRPGRRTTSAPPSAQRRHPGGGDRRPPPGGPSRRAPPRPASGGRARGRGGPPAEDRCGCRDHRRHRRADQPVGAECRHRGRARWRARQGVRGGRR